MSDTVATPLLLERFDVEKCTIVVEVKAVNVIVPPERVEVGIQTDDLRAYRADAATSILDAELHGRQDVSNQTVICQHSDAVIDTDDLVIESLSSANLDVAEATEVATLLNEDLGTPSSQHSETTTEKTSVDLISNESINFSASDISTDEDYDAADGMNPLLADDYAESETVEHPDLISEASFEEFQPRAGSIDALDPDDPKTILTWNSSGLKEVRNRKVVWQRFVSLITALKPDIIVLQNVKLCESPVIGKCPKIMERGDGRAVQLPYEQQLQDGQIVDDLKRDIFKRYHLVHSLACWRIGGQLIFVKKRFSWITERYSLNSKVHPKYHHPEGRSILLQFKSYNLLCVMSPVNGWNKTNVKQHRMWYRDLAHLLFDLKGTIISSHDSTFSDTKAVVMCGNLNCAPEDIDLSDADKLKLENSPVLHASDNTGYPGCRAADREGLRWIMLAGRLVDTFRRLHPYKDPDKDSKNLKYTSLGILNNRLNAHPVVYLGDKTRCAVRTNLTLISNYFLKNVAQCDIIGSSSDLVTAYIYCVHVLSESLWMAPSTSSTSSKICTTQEVQQINNPDIYHEF
ncbi:exonuclease III APE [Babesia ovis]|uniref:Exonuclease III APE n=1 Tax=Babesia ovis TaxID=5869 RepID=A0A9W5T8E2_BABOV|nr:exonuclease III APE [Babesia ovis]